MSVFKLLLSILEMVKVKYVDGFIKNVSLESISKGENYIYMCYVFGL